MVRIKGSNSDYVFDLGTGQIQEQSKDQPVYLKIFVCPNDMPSQVEKPYGDKAGNWCQGTDAECPDPNKKNGHALICLHQTEGIALVTPNPIVAKGPFQVQPNGQQSVFQVTETNCVVTGSVVLQTSQGKGFQISVSSEGIVLQTPDAAMIRLTNNSIEITPGKTGTVKINGNLDVTGEITMAGQPLPASA
jgi:hypothetical protein